MEEEIAETGSSLDEQKEEEWIYPCLPSNESNSLSLTLFDCPPCLPNKDEYYVPVDSPEIITMIKTCDNNYAALSMIIRAIFINLMIILYLCLISKCMVLKSFA